MPCLECVLVGNESLLIQCAAILKGRGHKISAVVTHSDEVIAWAEREGLDHFAPGPGLETRLADALPNGFDWLFSIANLMLLPQSVITQARGGAINFHDGPLPRHAGLNAPVWALIEGEAQHGITWHLIEPGVDTGDIVEQVLFDITPEDTAFSLNARCYASAIESFPAVMAGVERGTPPRRPQDMSLRSQHRRDDRPAFGGLLDFTRPASELARLVCGLDHGGYWNPLTLPKVDTPRGVLIIGSAAECAGSGTPGTVLAAEGGTLTIACGHGALRLEALTCLRGFPIMDAAAPGTVLPIPEPVLSEVHSRIARGEAGWRRALKGFAPLGLPLHGTGAAATPHILPLSAQHTAAILSLYGEGAGIALQTAETRALAAESRGMIADWLPISLAGETLADRVSSLASAFAQAKAAPGYPRDLVLRDPALSAPGLPTLALVEGAQPLPGAALSLCFTEAGATLVADPVQLDEGTVALYLSRLNHLAGADMEAPINALDLFSPADAALLARINATAQPFEALTLSQAFEAQVTRNPQATALAFEGREVSYATLNARANRAAHVLRGMGVGPGVPVGLCLKRGPALLEAALAILKAGGAYVPMDPAYPAERLAHYLSDSGAPVIVTERALLERLPAHHAQLLIMDTDARLMDAPETNPGAGAGPNDLAYVIYTSGSTGTPKGVMVEHRNVANFFTGMDARIRHDPPGVWLAVTSINFDISVLELFWTLARGFKIVLTSDEGRLELSGAAQAISDKKMDFSLFFWGNDDGPGPRKYQLLLDAARFADTHGFSAVWTPERHFHAFGGPYPNPGITGAAVAAVTNNIAVRAGSIVVPLHHPLRIAEDWAVIDNLTNGRSGLGIASGWHPVDFVLRPENAPPNNKKAMFETIETLRRLWRGEAVEFDRGGGEMVAVQSLPRPVSKEAPIWLTIAGNPDTWREAGEIGAHVLTHLLGQSIDEVAEKIKLYHAALRGAGHDPANFTVTLMLHTYIARSREQAREVARGPMKSYLLSAAALVKQYAWAFPAFKRPAGVANPMEIDLSTLSQDEVDGILDYAFARYFEDSGLFGTVEDGIARVEQLKAIGVSEIGCLIDYGIAPEMVMEGLFPLAEVLRRANAATQFEEGDHSMATQIQRHGVTHLQCTPSMARLFLADPGARSALSRVQNVMIGGEALPATLARELAQVTGQPVENMYGPTETTIWSTTGPALGEGTARLGAPIANTTLHILGEGGRPMPVGQAGELWIGGAGVARGYWQRPELTAQRFVEAPGVGRIYGTGDLVRMAPDGTLDFLGRIDHQVKIRGHRIELGEIEAVLDALPGVAQSVVVARPDAVGGARLVAYVKGSAHGARAALIARLPEVMVPQDIVEIAEFPLTPNRKIDRNALPDPVTVARATVPAAPAQTSGTAAQIAQVWSKVLGVTEVKPEDNFFSLGGHSLLAVQAHRDLRSALGLPGLSITDVFRFPVLSGLAKHIDARLRPIQTDAPEPAPETSGVGRLDAMARRRQMRADRLSRLG